MITETPRYRLPDQGFTLTQWAHDLARGKAASVVQVAVERHRRADGRLTAADLAGFQNVSDGPLAVLHTLLELEAAAVGRWSRSGFTRFHRRAADKRVQHVCRELGVEAAVDWALANATTGELFRDDLRTMLGPRLYVTRGEDALHAKLARSLQQQREQRHRNELPR